jgi:hypothetical protein
MSIKVPELNDQWVNGAPSKLASPYIWALFNEYRERVRSLVALGYGPEGTNGNAEATLAQVAATLTFAQVQDNNAAILAETQHTPRHPVGPP